MLVCVYEDRPAALIGVKLLVLSLESQCPGLPIAVSCPLEDRAFGDWVRRHECVEFHEDPSMAGQGWNSKPVLLKKLLDDGHEEVIWIDSDVIVARDFRHLLRTRGQDEIVVGQEQYWGLHQGGTIRTRLWGLAPGRPLPWTANSGFVRVTPAHRSLLDAWLQLLSAPEYAEAQRQEPMHERPIHMQGDQDVLTALLAARDFADLPVAFLRRGRDIVQCIGPGGYAVHERLLNLWRGLPPLVHGIDPKPWQLPTLAATNGLKDQYHRVACELSPYAWVAQRHIEALGEPLPGVEVRTLAGRILDAAAFGNPTARGIPLALFHSLGKRVRRILGLTPWRNAEAVAGRVMEPWGQRLIDANPRTTANG